MISRLMLHDVPEFRGRWPIRAVRDDRPQIYRLGTQAPGMLGLGMEEVVPGGHGRTRLYPERDIVVTGTYNLVEVGEWQTASIDGLADDDIGLVEVSSED